MKENREDLLLGNSPVSLANLQIRKTLNLSTEIEGKKKRNMAFAQNRRQMSLKALMHKRIRTQHSLSFVMASSAWIWTSH